MPRGCVVGVSAEAGGGVVPEGAYGIWAGGIRVLGGGLIVVRCSGPWSSLVGFALGVCEIVGSNPTGPTTIFSTPSRADVL